MQATDDVQRIRALRATLSRVFGSNVCKKLPGALPVSASKAIIERILPLGYVSSPKADGVRVFVIAAHNEPLIIIDRAFNVSIDAASIVNTTQACLCVFDAEWLPSRQLLLLFDCIAYRSLNMTRHCVRVRHELAMAAVAQGLGVTGAVSIECLAPPLSLPSRFKATTATRLPSGIEVRAKPLQTIAQLCQTWPHRREWLDYDDDGIVFTKIGHDYLPFRAASEQVVKYKPPQKITIDFSAARSRHHRTVHGLAAVDRRFTTDAAPGPIALLLSSGSCFAHAVADPSVDDMSDGAIVECTFRDGRQWVVVGVRSDKQRANDDTTVVRTCANIEEAVTEEQLLALLAPSF